uniref:Uncharacterized protein n=1 Tax=Vespula pensylvanica TaxID=30213 RepID=A0A834PG98_VESPE|nr:hypothetical protein H0235_001727 [Vespula pensylvanica]
MFRNIRFSSSSDRKADKGPLRSSLIYAEPNVSTDKSHENYFKAAVATAAAEKQSESDRKMLNPETGCYSESVRAWYVTLCVTLN